MKKWLSFEEQAQLLIDRKLYVEDKIDLIKFLEKKNYYYISGYLYNFRCNDKDEYQDPEAPDGVLRFKKIKSIMQLDELLRVIFTYPVELIERDFKTKIAYYSSEPSDYEDSSLREKTPLWYTEESNFIDHDKFERFHKILEREKIGKKDMPFIKHYIDNYNGIMPIWVAVEILSFGSLFTLFNNIPVKKRRTISNCYKCRLDQFESWIKALIRFRNLLAHDYRLYKYKIKTVPKQKKGFCAPTHQIFDYVLVCRHLIREQSLWNDVVIKNLQRLDDNYAAISFKDAYGFPDNWQNYLRI